MQNLHCHSITFCGVKLLIASAHQHLLARLGFESIPPFPMRWKVYQIFFYLVNFLIKGFPPSKKSQRTPLFMCMLQGCLHQTQVQPCNHSLSHKYYRAVKTCWTHLDSSILFFLSLLLDILPYSLRCALLFHAQRQNVILHTKKKKKEKMV